MSHLSLQDQAAPAINSDYFPEHLFPTAAADSSSFLAETARGYSRMASQRVVIGGLARNLGSIVDTTIARVERLGRMFADYRVVLYENDSADETPTRLKQWSENNSRVFVLSEQLNNPVNKCDRSQGRAQRMAHYRRQCHRTICQRHPDFDHVILVDTDMEGGWSYDGVASTFGKNDWDFVGSNGVIFRRHRLDLNRMVQYDAWAYRDDESFSPKTTAEVNAITYRRGEELVPVTSCFGGLGVYRMAAFQAGEYDESAADTEHVPFHRSMRNRGFARAFINPSQVTLYGRRHRTYDKYVLRFCRLRDELLGRPETEFFFEKGVTQLARQLCERRAA